MTGGHGHTFRGRGDGSARPGDEAAQPQGLSQGLPDSHLCTTPCAA